MKMGKKQYRTILFDVDGTLLDFVAAEKFGLQYVLKTQGVTPTEALEERYHKINEGYWKAFEQGEISRDQIMGNRFVDFFKTLDMMVNGREMESMFREELNKSAVLLDGAIEICRYLKAKYRMYVVTNGVSETQYKRLAASKLDQFFDDIFVSEDTGSQKPMFKYFEYCFARIPEANPGEMLIIGDSLSSDIKGGNIAGIDTCWINPDKFGRKAGIQVDYEIRKLDELKSFL